MQLIHTLNDILSTVSLCIFRGETSFDALDFESLGEIIPTVNLNATSYVIPRRCIVCIVQDQVMHDYCFYSTRMQLISRLNVAFGKLVFSKLAYITAFCISALVVTCTRDGIVETSVHSHFLP